MNRENELAILYWRTQHGGHNTRPAGHALKTLGECVELCIAAGANAAEIHDTVYAEIQKALLRKEHGEPFNYDKVCEEIADVDICLEVLCQHNIINRDKVVADKIIILGKRQWEPDKDGVLRRPGHMEMLKS
jgi:hypothetical protein